MIDSEPIGLYLHIPFCARKCPYCDFNTYAGQESLYDDTVDALCAELRKQAALVAGRAVATVFVGGGTPTVLDAAQLGRLFETVYDAFTLAPGAEITSEANPGTVDQSTFGVLRSLGVNRLSLGAQSFQADELEFLGRIHGVDDVDRAVAAARKAGFDNLNLDLIFGLPHQHTASWADSLEKALALEPEHLSLYSLIVEENTPLFHWVESGRVDSPDDDLAADHYELAMARLADEGFSHYEVSNWARTQVGELGATEAGDLPRRASRHNCMYWLNREWLGIGPGAHSHLRLENEQGQKLSRRWANRKSVAGYVRRMREGGPVEEFSEVVAQRASMGETMMLGLRLVRHGVTLDSFLRRYGLPLQAAFAGEADELVQLGLLEVTPERVRLTRRGLMLGNQVFARFVSDEDAETDSGAGMAIATAAHVV
jgi:oxygen-independent coproporphyrinogen III oxidase